MGDEFGLLTDKEQAFVDSYTEKIRADERERIIALIKGAPVSFEWFQPFVGTITLIEQINGETNG